MWLFLDLVAAESLVVLVSSLAPNFVMSLALVAFANGLWMTVGGFLVSMPVLNVFWKYVFHYIDYQSYVFQGMMVNEFGRRSYTCGEGCKIPGTTILAQYGYRMGKEGEWVGILLGIILGYRILGWMAIHVRKT